MKLNVKTLHSNLIFPFAQNHRDQIPEKGEKLFKLMFFYAILEFIWHECGKYYEARAQQIWCKNIDKKKF